MLVQGVRADGGKLGLQRLAHRRIRRGFFGCAAAQHAVKIQSRAAAEDREVSPPGNRPCRGKRRRGVIRRRIRRVRRADINHMMPHARLFFLRRLRRADIHRAVNLHGIDRDKLSAVPLADRQRKRALAAPCAADHRRRGAYFTSPFFSIHASTSVKNSSLLVSLCSSCRAPGYSLIETFFTPAASRRL